MIPLVLCCSMLGASDSSLLQLESGDTITIVGNTFAERMQHFPYFEAGLRAAYPGLDVHVRNLAWSADEVALQPRPLNFAGMDAHIDRVGTDVLIACFGMNESFASEDGLLQFRRDLGTWLDEHAKYRLILVSPVAHESLGGRMREGGTHTFDIGRYTAVMRDESQRRGVPFIDLHRPTRQAMAGDSDLTINGIHLNDAGHKVVAREMLVRLGIDPAGLDVPTERLADLREKNRWVFERFRPTNTEYVYGRRHAPFGVDNFPAEMQRLEDLAAAADVALAEGNRVDGRAMLAAMEPLPVPQVPEPEWDDVAAPPQDRPVPAPADQVENFVLPDGWSINSFASEDEFPELANPIAMNFDGDGRLWVIVAPTYPHVMPGEKPADKLIVLEDTNHDGHADMLTVFADGLYIPTGFATNGDEAWVVSQPNLVHVVDTDGDGVSDFREIVLHGFGPEDSHHVMSAFARPPDGSIYFQEGTFHHSQIESPDGPRRSINAAVYRYDPDTAEVEVASSWPWANPWGHVVDAWGRSIITDGTSGTSRRLTHIAGAHAYPDTLKGSPEVRGVPSFTPSSRRPAGGTEILGGSHLPAEARGRMVIPQNIGYYGLHWYDLDEVDSGYAARAVDPDLVYSTDPTCRPVDVEVGPDGAIYMLDWANPIVGHMQFSVRDPRRDHTHGRVWRITKNDSPSLEWTSLGELEIPALLTNLEGEAPWSVRRSRIELQRRPADEVLPEAVEWADRLDDSHALVETLWLHQAHGVVNEGLLDRVLSSNEPRARAAAVAVLRTWRDELEVIDRLRPAVLDVDAGVRVEAILALGFVEDPRAVELLSLAMRQPVDAGTRAVLARSLATLEPFGTPGGEGTEAWRLAKLSDGELLAVPLDYFSSAERMVRGSLSIADRRSAADWLAAKSGRPVAFEVWDAVRGAPDGGGAEVLLSLAPEELLPLRESMQSMLDDRDPMMRRNAWAGLALVDGWDQAWSAASIGRGTMRRVDLLSAAAQWPAIAGDSGAATMSLLLKDGPRDKSGAVEGQRIRVELDGNATLTLAEVEVISGGQNVALGKPCSQSTTRWEGVASRAVDGDANGAWEHGASTHTIEGEPDPWWEVDLGGDVPIERVVLHNRIDQPHHKRLEGFSLVILDAAGDVVWRQDDNPAPEYRVEIVPGGDTDLPVRVAAMNAMAAASPSAETLATLAPWTASGEEHLRLQAAMAMDRVPESLWPPELSQHRLKRVKIGTVPHKMMYDIKRFDVFAGQPVELELVNTDKMPHNLIIAKPGSLRRIGRAADAQGLDGEAAERHYVPDVDGILHASPLVLEGKTEYLRFLAPDRPGRYPYICTYPAHWQMMNGVMGVRRP